MRKLILLSFITMRVLTALAQQAYPVYDTMALQSAGLTYGFRILNEKEKDVHKDAFSRYSLQFFVTNTSDQAKMLVRRPGSGLLVSSTSSNLVRFQCTNATGARFTSKEATLQAKPCIVEAIVDDKECGTDKVVQHERPVNIGFWIRPGETITANVIVIVPLNEKPAVMATLFPMSNGTITGSASWQPDPVGAVGVPDTYPGQPYGGLNPGQPQGVLHLRSIATGGYLNSQTDRIIAGDIRPDWLSAQWELLPIKSSSYFLLRNKLSGKFISVGKPSLLSDDGQNPASMWVLEPAGGEHTYTIRNVANSMRLALQNNLLTVSDKAAEKWSIEP